MLCLFLVYQRTVDMVSVIGAKLEEYHFSHNYLQKYETFDPITVELGPGIPPTISPFRITGNKFIDILCQSIYTSCLFINIFLFN